MILFCKEYIKIYYIQKYVNLNEIFFWGLVLLGQSGVSEVNLIGRSVNCKIEFFWKKIYRKGIVMYSVIIYRVL